MSWYRSMQPLSSFKPAGIRGLVFDIDDTVTKDGVLVPEAYSAMHALRDAGVILVAVTGRPLGWADVVARLWPVAFAVGENGAGWTWVADGKVHEGYFCAAEERMAQRTLLDRIVRDVQAHMPHVRASNDQRARRCDLAFDVAEEATLSESDIAKLVGIIEAGGAKSAVSSVHAHAIAGDWNKANGVSRAMTHVLGVDLASEQDTWAFIGDSGNDEAAFAFFDWSVGVANVRESLDGMTHHPKFVTDASRGHGFAELARTILSLRTIR